MPRTTALMPLLDEEQNPIVYDGDAYAQRRGSARVVALRVPAVMDGWRIMEGHDLVRALRAVAESRARQDRTADYATEVQIIGTPGELPPLVETAGVYTELEVLGRVRPTPGEYTAVARALGRCREWVAQRMRVVNRVPVTALARARANGLNTARVLSLARVPAERAVETVEAFRRRDLRTRGQIGAAHVLVDRAIALVAEARQREPELATADTWELAGNALALLSAAVTPADAVSLAPGELTVVLDEEVPL